MNVDMPAIVDATEGVLAPEALVEDDVGSGVTTGNRPPLTLLWGSGRYERSSRILTSNEFNPSMTVGVSALGASGHGDRTALSMLGPMKTATVVNWVPAVCGVVSPILPAVAFSR